MNVCFHPLSTITEMVCELVESRLDRVKDIFSTIPVDFTLDVKTNDGGKIPVSVDLRQSIRYIGKNAIVNNLCGKVGDSSNL